MKRKNKKTIVICSSASFYEKVAEVETKLKGIGFKVKSPLNVSKMKKSGNYKVESYKTWYKNPDDYKRKAFLTRKHFNEVIKGDAVLVLNYEKNGKLGYIGGAVLMEMGIAFHFKKPIYILNKIDESSNLKEEIYGFLPTILNGDFNLIKK
ncbi:MAG: hypothetical protein WC908_00180 [Candidatus Paceibacterota bacterium]